MAKAHRAPMDSYEPHLAVSDHAVLRFRERAGDFLEQGGFLSDEAVGYQLDAAIWDAMQDDSQTFDILDSGQLSRLVRICHPSWGSLWALVRENKHPRYPQKWAVITVLTDWQMTQNALDGRYSGHVPRLPQFAKHFEARDKALAAREAARPQLVASAPVPDETPPAPTITPEENMSSAPAPLSPVPSRADDLRLLTWLDAAGSHQEELERAEVPDRIEALRSRGVSLEAIRIWRPAKVRIEVE